MNSVNIISEFDNIIEHFEFDDKNTMSSYCQKYMFCLAK